MAKSITVTPKKKRGRPATGRDPHVTARLPQNLIDAIEVWAFKNGSSRSEAIRRLVEIGLKAKTK
ncbi:MULTISPECIES: ribbon-helix-helix domain-containing protein [Bradyrhizobium]|uniref:ribbon-helix-helix domain-containing protein n=1 Tax=Bradyrhizobium TaxID=374 RepID=UPI000944BA9B